MRNTLGVFIAFVYFFGNVVLAHSAEVNFWRERQKKQTPPEKNEVQLAALPASLPVGRDNPADLLRQIPTLSKTFNAISENALPEKFKPSHVPADLRPVLERIPTNAGTIKQVSIAPTDKSMVVLLQDVHMNTEAQGNIAEIVKAMRVPVVAVEGAEGPFNFSDFENFKDGKIKKAVADSFLHQNLISAPSYAGVLSEKGKLQLVGVDDADRYQANVNAYKEATREKNAVEKRLKNKRRRLAEQKGKELNEALKKFDAHRAAYEDGTLAFGDYIKWLASDDASNELVINQFLAAYQIEKRLDFERVERERARVVEQLAQKLDTSDLNSLLAQSVAYRLGKISYAGYYGWIKTFMTRAHLSLSDTPAFDEYIQYVLLTEGINAEKLFAAMKNLEARTVASLCRTPREKELMQASRLLFLEQKLVDFALTPEEWAEYQRMQGSEFTMGRVGWGIDTVDLNSFENFYREADVRSHAMVRNLNRLSRSPSVLIVGGFHTPLVTKLLRVSGRSFVVVQPKITKIEGLCGSEYLSVFTQERTTLDQIFEGQKLFLAPLDRHAGKDRAVTGKMYGAMLAIAAGPGEYIKTPSDGIFATTGDVPFWGHLLGQVDIENLDPNVKYFAVVGAATLFAILSFRHLRKYFRFRLLRDFRGNPPIFQERNNPEEESAYKGIAFRSTRRHPNRHFNGDSSSVDVLFNGISMAGVYDGVSGAKNADIASRESNNYVRARLGLFLQRWSLDALRAGFTMEMERELETEIGTIFRDVERYLAGQINEGGTTVSLAISIPLTSGDQRVLVVNGGDSRVYAEQAGALQQLTIDNRYAKGSYDLGGVSDLKKDIFKIAMSEFGKDPIRGFNFKGQVANDLTPHGRYVPQFTKITTAANMRLILASDGLWKNVTEFRQSLLAVKFLTAEDLAQELIDEAIRRCDSGYGRRDDITVAVIAPRPLPPEQLPVRVWRQEDVPKIKNRKAPPLTVLGTTGAWRLVELGVNRVLGTKIHLSDNNVKRFVAPVLELTWFAGMLHFPIVVGTIFFLLHLPRSDVSPSKDWARSTLRLAVLSLAFSVVFVLPAYFYLTAGSLPMTQDGSLSFQWALILNGSLHVIYNVIAVKLKLPVLTAGDAILKSLTRNEMQLIQAMVLMLEGDKKEGANIYLNDIDPDIANMRDYLIRYVRYRKNAPSAFEESMRDFIANRLAGGPNDARVTAFVRSFGRLEGDIGKDWLFDAPDSARNEPQRKGSRIERPTLAAFTNWIESLPSRDELNSDSVDVVRLICAVITNSSDAFYVNADLRKINAVVWRRVVASYFNLVEDDRLASKKLSDFLAKHEKMPGYLPENMREALNDNFPNGAGRTPLAVLNFLMARIAFDKLALFEKEKDRYRRALKELNGFLSRIAEFHQEKSTDDSVELVVSQWDTPPDDSTVDANKTIGVSLEDVNGTPAYIRKKIKATIANRSSRPNVRFALDRDGSVRVENQIVPVSVNGIDSSRFPNVVEALRISIGLLLTDDPAAKARLMTQAEAVTVRTAGGYHSFRDAKLSTLVARSTLSAGARHFFLENHDVFQWYVDEDLLGDFINVLGGKGGTPVVTLVVKEYLENVYEFETARSKPQLKAALASLIHSYKFSRAVELGRVWIQLENDDDKKMLDENEPISKLSPENHAFVVVSAAQAATVSDFQAFVTEQRRNPANENKFYVFHKLYRSQERLWLVTARDGRIELNYASTTYSEIAGQLRFQRQEAALGYIDEAGIFRMIWYMKPSPEHAHEWTSAASSKVTEMFAENKLQIEDNGAGTDLLISELHVQLGIAYGPNAYQISREKNRLVYRNPLGLHFDFARYPKWVMPALQIAREHGIKIGDRLKSLMEKNTLTPKRGPVILQSVRIANAKGDPKGDGRLTMTTIGTHTAGRWFWKKILRTDATEVEDGVYDNAIKKRFAPVFEIMWFIAMLAFPPLIVVFYRAHLPRGDEPALSKSDRRWLKAATVVVFGVPLAGAYFTVVLLLDFNSFDLFLSSFSKFSPVLLKISAFATGINYVLHQIYNPIAVNLKLPALAVFDEDALPPVVAGLKYTLKAGALARGIALEEDGEIRIEVYDRIMVTLHKKNGAVRVIPSDNVKVKDRAKTLEPGKVIVFGRLSNDQLGALDAGFPNTRISGSHFSVEMDDAGRITIRDLFSTNDTYFTATKITPNSGRLVTKYSWDHFLRAFVADETIGKVQNLKPEPANPLSALPVNLNREIATALTEISSLPVPAAVADQIRLLKVLESTLASRIGKPEYTEAEYLPLRACMVFEILRLLKSEGFKSNQPMPVFVRKKTGVLPTVDVEISDNEQKFWFRTDQPVNPTFALVRDGERKLQMLTMERPGASGRYDAIAGRPPVTLNNAFSVEIHYSKDIGSAYFFFYDFPGRLVQGFVSHLDFDGTPSPFFPLAGEDLIKSEAAFHRPDAAEKTVSPKPEINTTPVNVTEISKNNVAKDAPSAALFGARLFPGAPENFSLEMRPNDEKSAALQGSTSHDGQGSDEDKNQDRVFVDNDRKVALVADGISIPVGGAAAAAVTAYSASARLLAGMEILQKQTDARLGDVISLAKNSAEFAQAAVMREDFRRSAWTGLSVSAENAHPIGSTLLMVIPIQVRLPNGAVVKKAVIVSHGDSAIIVVKKDGRYARVTDVDNVAGTVTRENATLPKAKKIEVPENPHGIWAEITSHIGMNKFKWNPHNVRIVDLDIGDRILAMTDGVSGNLSDKEIAEHVLKEPNPFDHVATIHRESMERGAAHRANHDLPGHSDDVSMVSLAVDETFGQHLIVDENTALSVEWTRPLLYKRKQMAEVYTTPANINIGGIGLTLNANAHHFHVDSETVGHDPVVDPAQMIVTHPIKIGREKASVDMAVRSDKVSKKHLELTPGVVLQVADPSTNGTYFFDAPWPNRRLGLLAEPSLTTLRTLRLVQRFARFVPRAFGLRVAVRTLLILAVEFPRFFVPTVTFRDQHFESTTLANTAENRVKVRNRILLITVLSVAISMLGVVPAFASEMSTANRLLISGASLLAGNFVAHAPFVEQQTGRIADVLGEFEHDQVLSKTAVADLVKILSPTADRSLGLKDALTARAIDGLARNLTRGNVVDVFPALNLLQTKQRQAVRIDSLSRLAAVESGRVVPRLEISGAKTVDELWREINSINTWSNTNKKKVTLAFDDRLLAQARAQGPMRTNRNLTIIAHSAVPQSKIDLARMFGMRELDMRRLELVVSRRVRMTHEMEARIQTVRTLAHLEVNLYLLVDEALRIAIPIEPKDLSEFSELQRRLIDSQA